MKPNGLPELMARVEKNAAGCWLYTGPLTDSGYGCFSSRFGTRAHRVSWALHCGPIPRGLNVLHRCDVRNCINPDHLFLGSHADNVADMIEKGRAALGARKGAKQTAEARAAISRAMRIRMADPATRQSIGAARRQWAQRTSPNERRRGRYKPCPPRECARCGETFEVTYPSSKQRFCSRGCARRSR